MTKRLIVYNIEYCEGLKGQWWSYLMFWRALRPPKELDSKIISEIKKYQPDILGLVEVDLGSSRFHHRDEAKYFEDSLEMKGIAEKVKYAVKSRLNKVPVLKYQGNAILSKTKLTNTKYHLFSKGTKKVVIQTTAHIPEKITLILAHLALGKKARKTQLTELVNIVNSIKTPVILMGDFNTFKGHRELDYLLDKTHLSEKVSFSNPVLTQPAIKPKKQLDHILTSSEIDVKKYRSLDFTFSDHLPLMIDFEVKK